MARTSPETKIPHRPDGCDLPGRIDWLRDHAHPEDSRVLGELIARAAPPDDFDGRAGVWPPGLTALLTRLRQELWVHQVREQALVFPLMQTARRAQIQHSVCRMIDDHEALRARIAQTARVIAAHHPSSEDAAAWGDWAVAFGVLERQLRERLGAEERELFMQFF